LWSEKYERCWNRIRPFLGRDKIRSKIKRSEKNKKNDIKKCDVGKVNKKEVEEEFIKDVTANEQNTQSGEMEGINWIRNIIRKKE